MAGRLPSHLRRPPNETGCLQMVRLPDFPLRLVGDGWGVRFEGIREPRDKIFAFWDEDA